jgi:TolA-binding protein
LIASSDATDLERKLLESWNDERPSPAARANVLAALGLATTAVSTVGAVGTSIAPKALASAATKWTIIGAVALGAAGAGTYAVTHRTERAPVEQQAAVVETRREPVKALERAEPVLRPEPVRPAAVETTKTHAQPAASTLTLQIAALDHARGALNAGDSPRARRLVDAYEAEYPDGAFTQEAEVVRIDALIREGNRDGAERVAKRFFAAYPRSPHAARVRGLLGYDPQ